jgi:hypothetical protein
MRSRLVYNVQDERPPQERMSNVRIVYGNKNVKSVTTKRTMMQNLQETGSRPFSLYDDEKMLDNPKEFILHLLQVNGP